MGASVTCADGKCCNNVDEKSDIIPGMGNSFGSIGLREADFQPTSAVPNDKLKTAGAKVPKNILSSETVAAVSSSSVAKSSAPSASFGAPPAAVASAPRKRESAEASANADRPAAAAITMDNNDNRQSSSASAERTLVSYKDGSTFSGQVQSGKRHGYGIWKSVTGEYDGYWEEDLQHGQGKQTWQDGRAYEGKFEAGKFHGTGRMEWTTPTGAMVYDGQYVNDTKHGQGRFVWPDGRVYSGEWMHGKRQGKGIYVNVKGETREGIWFEDRLDRWVTSTTTVAATGENAANAVPAVASVDP